MTQATEYWIAVESFIGTLAGIEVTVQQGFTATSDHPIVTRFAKFFVPIVGGEAIVNKRRFEIEQATGAMRTKQRDDLRAARIAQGSRPDSSDDAIAEAAKRAVKANPDFELVHDALTGAVVGARSKAGYVMTS
jgi:hypothetical protein